MKSNDLGLPIEAPPATTADEGPSVGLADLLTWIGEAKRLIGGHTGSTHTGLMLAELTDGWVDAHVHSR